MPRFKGCGIIRNTQREFFSMINKVINRMIEFNSPDARRINHALKVYAFAHVMAVNEGIKDTMVVDITAALHDIGITVCERKYHIPGT